MAKTVDEVADFIYQQISEAQGKKKQKPFDYIKLAREAFPGEVDPKLGKAAIKQLVDSGRVVYTYFGGTFLELPHKEGAAND